MIDLLPLMVERVGILVIVAFLLSRMRIFRQVLHSEKGFVGKMMLVAVFGIFGMISNYTGIEIHEGYVVSQHWLMEVSEDNAIANTRIMGVGIGGLLGGPLVGLGVGLLAGLHRLTLGGFTAVACALSSVLAGVAAGYLGKSRRRKGLISPWFAAVVGMFMEAVQMLIIILTARPKDAAYELVETIGLPMILINGFGTLLFMIIIRTIMHEKERLRAFQTHKAFYIADQTLPFFRQGLGPESCRKVAEILLELTEANAVAITDHRQVLAHVGAASDHHIAGQTLATELTRQVLEEGKIKTAKSAAEIQCFQEHCSLRAAVVLPLLVHGRTVGTLKLYFENAGMLGQVEQELAEGLARLFSTQLELADAEAQSDLLKDAKIKALQAQVHPHFLFNAINTISALCRTDPDKARRLLVELGIFFRSNLQGAQHMLISLDKELEYVLAYLSLEQARFPGRYDVNFEIDPVARELQIPPFLIQPLVENAIRHGYTHIRSKGKIEVKAWIQNDCLYITVEDNGKGVSPSVLDELGQRPVSSGEGTGTALFNIRERLQGIYRHRAQFSIKSEVGKGTYIEVSLPLQGKENVDHVESVCSG
ncbi:sensor histidine kinase [Paenibacillus sp. Marseille-Q4541]|uniref:sensor histidine kinase n=1 Tax=Paenibacillus sp. Marseille-Q4541 TaxID=2831522 RepID=UPI001BA6CB58|nr:sensor histidine kinase [Paenibacillus sp. Marseille-Q4541]